MSTSAYHLPNLHHHTDSNNQETSSSLPTTPTSNNNNKNGSTTPSKAVHYRYEPYKNFSRVYVSSTPSTSRANSRSTTPRNGNNACNNEESSYCYTNDKKKECSDVQHGQQQYHPSFELEAISGTNTPTARMETEQNFPGNKNNNKKQQQDETSSSSAPSTPRHHGIMNSSSASSTSEENNMMLPKPRSAQQQEQSQQEPMRAAVRTMQHLLQNVPYLFLDLVAESTVLCREQHHKVGQHIAPWSGLNPSAMSPEDQQRYHGQAIRDVFVAQLPFDLPLEAIQLVADLLIEGPRVNIIHAAPHIKAHRSYDGCCFVKMFEEDANRFIAAMHKRVLFDVDGVWVATTLPELQELTDYCAWFQEQKSEQRKEILKMPTPFSAMTAEFALRGSRNIQQRPSPAYFNNNNANTVVDQNPHQRHLAQLFNSQQQQQRSFNNRNAAQQQQNNGGYYQNTYYAPSCNTNYYGSY